MRRITRCFSTKVSVRNLLQSVSGTLSNNSSEARSIIRHSFTPVKSLEDLFLIDTTKVVPSSVVRKCNDLTNRRKNGEPLAYVLGYKEFYSRDFKVTSDTLIPRSDSETLITTILKHPKCGKRILDLGTGSGALLITLLLEIPSAVGTGVDISPAALEVARTNASSLLGQSSRATWKCADYNTSNMKGTYDVIVCNPPYIAVGDPHVASDVALHEPHGALYADSIDGLSHYKLLASHHSYHNKILSPEGIFVLEVGINQPFHVIQIFESTNNWKCINVVSDLQDVPRVLVFKPI